MFVKRAAHANRWLAGYECLNGLAGRHYAVHLSADSPAYSAHRSAGPSHPSTPPAPPSHEPYPSEGTKEMTWFGR